MMVAAWSDGIISCPAGFQDQEGVKKALGIPNGHTVSMGVTFGYPAPGSAESANRGKRLAMDEIVHWGRW
jgi:nitroreductase